MKPSKEGATPGHYGSIRSSLRNIAGDYLRGLETALRLLGSLLLIGVLCLLIASLVQVTLILPLRFFELLPREPDRAMAIHLTIIGLFFPLVLRFGLQATGFDCPARSDRKSAGR